MLTVYICYQNNLLQLSNNQVQSVCHMFSQVEAQLQKIAHCNQFAVHLLEKCGDRNVLVNFLQ